MKKVIGQIKLQIPAGKATPAPPVGPALGKAGVNIMDFCKAFNAKTAKDEGLIIPVVITVYADRSYTFITKPPPVAVLTERGSEVDGGGRDHARQAAGAGVADAALPAPRGGGGRGEGRVREVRRDG